MSKPSMSKREMVKLVNKLKLYFALHGYSLEQYFENDLCDGEFRPCHVCVINREDKGCQKEENHHRLWVNGKDFKVIINTYEKIMEENRYQGAKWRCLEWIKHVL